MALLLVSEPSTLNAQPAAPNRVLELDGVDSFLELPPVMLEGLEAVTIEGWVKWQKQGEWTRFFTFCPGATNIPGGRVPELSFLQFGSTSAFQFLVMLPPVRYGVQTPNLLRANQWCHIAAVLEKNGARFYFNGWLAGSDGRGFTPPLPKFSAGYIGKSSNTMNELLHGQIDELRVWKIARTVEQIREGMFKKFTGQEENLVGCWDFEAGDARDLSPLGNHGVFQGKAKTAPADFPDAAEIAKPAVIQGRVLAASGTRTAEVQLEQNRSLLAKSSGNQFDLVIFHPSDQPCDLIARMIDQVVVRSGLRLVAGQTQRIDLIFTGAGTLSGSVRTFDPAVFHPAVPVQLLCKKFAQRMDGELTVESEYGKGSTFTVCLPETLEERTMN